MRRMTTALPRGFVVKLNHRVRVKDGGSVLVGGAPTRVVYLADAARKMLVNRTLLVSDRQTAAPADRLLEMGMADPVIGELPDLDAAELTFVVLVRDRPVALDSGQSVQAKPGTSGQCHRRRTGARVNYPDLHRPANCRR